MTPKQQRIAKDNFCFALISSHSKRINYWCHSVPDRCAHGVCRENDEYKCRHESKHGRCVSPQARAEVFQKMVELAQVKGKK